MFGRHLSTSCAINSSGLVYTRCPDIEGSSQPANGSLAGLYIAPVGNGSQLQAKRPTNVLVIRNMSVRWKCKQKA
jgi:hypothetical protein